MIGGGEKPDLQRLAIQQVVQRFGGDVEAALHAFEAFAHDTINQKSDLGLVRPKRDTRPDAPVILSVESLKKVYKKGRQQMTVLDGVSFDIHQGEIIAITGVSGSGKSTLLHLLGGLDKPTSGDVLIDGTSLAKLSDRKLSAFRRQTIGFVFQFFYLQPFLRLQQNLEVPAMFARAKRTIRKQQAKELSEKVGLSDRIKHLPKELSGGQMQRAAIARALMNRPKIILADEPTGNLDSNNGKQIIELFESIRDEFNTTVVVVTHDPLIARWADRTITLVDGRLAT